MASRKNDRWSKVANHAGRALREDMAESLAKSPAIRDMMKSMMVQQAGNLCFEYLAKKPGRKVIITSEGPEDFIFSFIEPDGSKCEDPSK
jgi:hypothetical protein